MLSYYRAAHAYAPSCYYAVSIEAREDMKILTAKDLALGPRNTW